MDNEPSQNQPNTNTKAGRKFKWWYILIAIIVLQMAAIIFITYKNASPKVTAAAAAAAKAGAAGTTAPAGLEADAAKLEAARSASDLEKPEDANGLQITVFAFLPVDKDNEFITPDVGKLFYAIDVHIENTSDKTIKVDPQDWKIKASDGALFGYDDSALAAIDGMELQAATLAPGEKADGLVPFQVPKDGKDFVACYYAKPTDAKPALQFKLPN